MPRRPPRRQLRNQKNNRQRSKVESIQRKDFAQPDRAEVQDQVIRAVEANPEPFLAAYEVAPYNFGGRYVSADAFKDTFPQFGRSPEARNRYNAPVHNAAAVLASEQFRRALRDDSDRTETRRSFSPGYLVPENLGRDRLRISCERTRSLRRPAQPT